MQRERQAGTGEQGVNLAWVEGKGVTWLCVRKSFPPPSPGESLDPKVALFWGKRWTGSC